MMRKQALGAIFLTIGAINCIRERPQETQFFPRPVAIREGDFFRVATNIQRAEDFRIFEPLLEQLTNQRPIYSDSVHFIEEERIREVCQSHVRGCYDPQERRIMLSQSLLDSGRGRRIYLGLCTSNLDEGISTSARFLTWLHEQGHRFDNRLRSERRGQWIDQVEAEAFVYYVAETIARRYDMRLGLNILDQKAQMYLIQPSTTREALIRRTEQRDFNQWDIELANTSIFALLSGSFATFKEIWEFVHNNSEEEVERRIRADAVGENRAKRKFDQLIESIYPSRRIVREEFKFPQTIEMERALQREEVFGSRIETRNFRISRFNSGSGSSFWTIVYFGRGSVFRIRIEKESDRGINIEIEDEEHGRMLRIPNINRNQGELISFENPQNQFVCARSIRIIDVESRAIVDQIRNNLGEAAMQFDENRMERFGAQIRLQAREMFSE